MKNKKHKIPFPQVKQPELISEKEFLESSNPNHLSKGLESLNEGFNYILNGDTEDSQPKKRIYGLTVERHHILLILIIVCLITVFWAFKDSIKSPKVVITLPQSKTEIVQPPLSTTGKPITWAVEAPTAVNVKDIPDKLISQMNILYPDVSADSYRWFRTPKGWSAYYDAQKAKVKFSTEGYWLETEERNFPIKNIPKYLQDRIRMAYTNYTLVSCEHEISSSGDYYELTLKKNRPDNVNEEFVVYLSDKAYNYANLYEGMDY